MDNLISADNGQEEVCVQGPEFGRYRGATQSSGQPTNQEEEMKTDKLK